MNAGRDKKRRGNVVVLTAVLLVVLLGMVAFAIDVGTVAHGRAELQRAADACALAAAAYLPDMAEAVATAEELATQNSGGMGGMCGTPFVECGHWDRDTAVFSTPTPSGRNTNAVRVTLKRSEATGNPLILFFGGVLGRDSTDVAASAIAMYDGNLCGPLIGIEWVSVPGNIRTDSYNSDEGEYDAGDAGKRGSICSDGPIYVDGDANVWGDARAGKGYTVSITGNALVSGSIGSRLKPLSLPSVVVGDAATINDNDRIPLVPEGRDWRSPVDAEGNFLLDGKKSIDLPAGTYYFRNFTMTGQSRLNITGQATLYITGDLERSGGAWVNATGIPANLKVLMTGGIANITSNNDFHAVVYAPDTHVTVDGSADLFGAVVGRTLTVTGSGAAHYDESLGLGESDFPRRYALVD